MRHDRMRCNSIAKTVFVQGLVSLKRGKRNVDAMLLRRIDVSLTSFRRHMPAGLALVPSMPQNEVMRSLAKLFQQSSYIHVGANIQFYSSSQVASFVLQLFIYGKTCNF